MSNSWILGFIFFTFHYGNIQVYRNDLPAGIAQLQLLDTLANLLVRSLSSSLGKIWNWSCTQRAKSDQRKYGSLHPICQDLKSLYRSLKRGQSHTPSRWSWCITLSRLCPHNSSRSGSEGQNIHPKYRSEDKKLPLPMLTSSNELSVASSNTTLCHILWYIFVSLF